MQSVGDVKADVSRATIAVFRNVGIFFEQGSLAITSPDTFIGAGRFVSAAGRSFALTGKNATLQRKTTLVAQTGSYTITRKNASVFRNRLLTTDASAFNLTSYDTSLLNTRRLSLAGRNMTLSGQAMTPKIVMPAANNKFTLSSANTTLLWTQFVVANTGKFAVTSPTTSLQTFKKGLNTTGNFTLSSPNVAFGRMMPAANNRFTITSPNTAIYATRRLASNTGLFTLSGQATSMFATYPINAATGKYTATYPNTALLQGYRVAAANNKFTLSGQAINPNVTMPANTRTGTITGQNTTLLLGHRVQANTGSLALSGQAATFAYNSSVSWDPASVNYSNISFANNNNRALWAAAAFAQPVIASKGRSSGKYAFEIVFGVARDALYGVVSNTGIPYNGSTEGRNGLTIDNDGGGTATFYALDSTGTATAVAGSTVNDTWNPGDSVMFLCDLDNRKMYVRVNGRNLFGNVQAGTGGGTLPLTIALFPYGESPGSVNAYLDLHTTSASFNYSIPSGYTAWAGT
jgi:hypothetical protein